MATEILRPDAAGDECNIGLGCVVCPNHYTCVDEETADEATTVVKESTAEWKRDLYNLPAHSGSGTINKITLYFRVYSTFDHNNVKGVIKSNLTVTETAEKNPYSDFGDSTWGTYSQEWAINPADSLAWEWSDIDALQIGIHLYYAGWCTQVYVVVDYTPPPPYSPASRPAHMAAKMIAGKLI